MTSVDQRLLLYIPAKIIATVLATMYRSNRQKRFDYVWLSFMAAIPFISELKAVRRRVSIRYHRCGKLR
jgi:hypothetical protein